MRDRASRRDYRTPKRDQLVADLREAMRSETQDPRALARNAENVGVALVTCGKLPSGRLAPSEYREMGEQVFSELELTLHGDERAKPRLVAVD